MPAYDPHKRRLSSRAAGQRGVYIYIPAAELEAAGFDPADPPPFYTTKGTNVRGRRVMVNLYPERGTNEGR